MRWTVSNAPEHVVRTQNDAVDAFALPCKQGVPGSSPGVGSVSSQVRGRLCRLDGCDSRRWSRIGHMCPEEPHEEPQRDRVLEDGSGRPPENPAVTVIRDRGHPRTACCRARRDGRAIAPTPIGYEFGVRVCGPVGRHVQVAPSTAISARRRLRRPSPRSWLLAHSEDGSMWKRCREASERSLTKACVHLIHSPAQRVDPVSITPHTGDDHLRQQRDLPMWGSRTPPKGTGCRAAVDCRAPGGGRSVPCGP
jgi:hypothetical protein